MQSFLFSNTSFDEELINSRPLTPLQLLEKHPVYFQLQYLSLLVANPFETPLLSQPPSLEHLKHLEKLGFTPPPFKLISDPKIPCLPLSSWGASFSLKKWAFEKHCFYNVPSLEIVKKVHSKEFAFLHFPKPSFSTLIRSPQELVDWWGSFEGPKVLKTLYGASGRGHCITSGGPDDLKKALPFLIRNTKTSSACIAQPWVERLLDFSTQWVIEENGSYSYLGATLCENSSNGIYHRSITGPEDLLFKNQMTFFHKHLFYAKKALSLLISNGFFGNVGFDSFIYKDPHTNQILLYPIVEINARKTMGWVSLKIQKKIAREKLLAISYKSNMENPTSLLPSHKDLKPFAKQLFLETNPICF
jgi:hypothetical protein